MYCTNLMASRILANILHIVLHNNIDCSKGKIFTEVRLSECVLTQICNESLDEQQGSSSRIGW